MDERIKTAGEGIPSTKKDAIESTQRALDTVMYQRKRLGNMGNINDHRRKIDAVNDNIVSLQMQYKKLTGGFYIPK